MFNAIQRVKYYFHLYMGSSFVVIPIHGVKRCADCYT